LQAKILLVLADNTCILKGIDFYKSAASQKIKIEN